LGPDRDLVQLAQLIQGVRIEVRHGLISAGGAGCRAWCGSLAMI
jgi:hypothetical protein